MLCPNAALRLIRPHTWSSFLSSSAKYGYSARLFRFSVNNANGLSRLSTMASGSQDPQIVLYHYGYSPYARRVVWYLALRGIPYTECIQPPLLPRPDLKLLGISHRRIPILAIDRDVYFDSHLIMAKLESLFPHLPRLGDEKSSTPERYALERLLSMFTTRTGLFTAAFNLLPSNLPLLSSGAFYRDRGEFLGKQGTADLRENMKAARPESEADIARAMQFLENSLLADGRTWILGSQDRGGEVEHGPRLADIEAAWPFHWMTGIPGALPPEQFGEDKFPRMYQWVKRLQAAVSAAKKRAPKPKRVSGEEAARMVTSAPYEEEVGKVNETDGIAVAQGLRVGDWVVVWPTETGSAHEDTGKLVALDDRQIVFEVSGDGGSVRCHAPRQGFRFRKASGSKL